MQPYNHHLHTAILNQHMSDMEGAARENRLARQVRGPRPLQRRLGLLLIAAGEALTRAPLELELAGFESR
ncbi:MAG TPA: hypothetical protein VFE42_02390 [Chloroflexota bacterium]|nr:hypothetical protein [Chloroflexota bacterium]